MAFGTHSNHYKFAVMSLGLTNTPAMFQATMNDLFNFRPYLQKFVLVFFYDILVYSKLRVEYLIHLQIIQFLLQEQQFIVNKKKSVMGRTVIKYLGYIISFHGVAMDPSKVSNVLNWHVPRTIKGVREFLKLTGYYCRFIGRYGSIARPLTQLLKKEH